MYQDAPKLVIMAAGMGSRFGGLKQMEPVDDEGHSIIDLSMYDAAARASAIWSSSSSGSMRRCSASGSATVWSGFSTWSTSIRS